VIDARPGRRRRPASTAIAWSCALVLAPGLLAACLSSGPTGTAPTQGGSTSPATPDGGPSGEASRGPSPTHPSTTLTDWGLIYDAIPPSFPVPPGAAPTQTGGDPASSELSVPASSIDAVDAAAFYRDELTSMGLVVSSDGPLEDGSYTVSATDQLDCELQVSTAPLGDTTLIKILYGASCPFE
jgi:hypothetical protein